MSIHTDYITLTAALGRRAHSHRVALARSQLFSLRRFGRATASTEKNSDDSFDCGMESGADITRARALKKGVRWPPPSERSTFASL